MKYIELQLTQWRCFSSIFSSPLLLIETDFIFSPEHKIARPLSTWGFTLTTQQGFITTYQSTGPKRPAAGRPKCFSMGRPPSATWAQFSAHLLWISSHFIFIGTPVRKLSSFKYFTICQHFTTMHATTIYLCTICIYRYVCICIYPRQKKKKVIATQKYYIILKNIEEGAFNFTDASFTCSSFNN